MYDSAAASPDWAIMASSRAAPFLPPAVAAATPAASAAAPTTPWRPHPRRQRLRTRLRADHAFGVRLSAVPLSASPRAFRAAGGWSPPVYAPRVCLVRWRPDAPAPGTPDQSAAATGGTLSGAQVTPLPGPRRGRAGVLAGV